MNPLRQQLLKSVQQLFYQLNSNQCFNQQLLLLQHVNLILLAWFQFMLKDMVVYLLCKKSIIILKKNTVNLWVHLLLLDSKKMGLKLVKSKQLKRTIFYHQTMLLKRIFILKNTTILSNLHQLPMKLNNQQHRSVQTITTKVKKQDIVRL